MPVAFDPPPPAPGLPCPAAELDVFLSTPDERVLSLVATLRGPVLVLGAGGKIGLHLCLMLQRALDRVGNRQAHVLAVSRFTSLRDRAVFADHHIRTHACDLTDAGAVAALPDAAVVFFLAGIKFGTASAPELLRRFNVDMPRLVALRFRTARIVAFSSGCVYPFVSPRSGGADERVAPAPPGLYAESCLQREEAFGEVAASHGARVALLRLNYSIEFRYGTLVDIAETIRRREPVDLDMGHLNVIWQSDAVTHSIQALEVAATPAQPINITGPEILHVRDLALGIARRLDLPVAFQGTESTTAWLNDAAWSHRLFGPPRVQVEQMLDWVCAWLAQDGATWGKPTGFQRRDGRF